ncbi:MAG: potassium-transporting ATPase subunit KdpC [Anaerolineales bacterium]|nr:potassium-transporting ATPase subunit KdpC [Anaerolineales bacterium]MCW5838526.1 potassium-transporting ATPase subunit KdpC [Anaerolineales bacterium]
MAIRSVFFPAFVLLVLFTLVTGVFYPVLVTGIAKLAFPNQANGSLLEQDGELLGSRLIGQPFTDPAYFWSRPSATGPFAYNAAASSGSNLGPSTQALYDAITDRVAALRAADPGNLAPVPVDLVTASASGLDPHISPQAAYYQAARVARLRGLSEEAVRNLILEHTERPWLGFWGQARVNVLELNVALDAYAAN